MDASRFELTMSVPRDERFVDTLRGLAVHAAQYAGCTTEAAEAFGGRVEQAMRATLERVPATVTVPIVVRRHDGPVEIQIESRIISVDV